MAKKTKCSKKCNKLSVQSKNSDCDGGVCPINKPKKTKMVSQALDSWNTVIDVCKDIVDKKNQ
jgi:hypothetical protein